MKSAAYIARLFKGYRIDSTHVEVIMGEFTWYRIKLTKRDVVTCIYDIYIRPDDTVETAKGKREQAQAKELVQALLALPRYEERR